MPRSSLCSAVSEVRRALSRSLLRCSLSSLFPDDSGTLAEELLYDSIVEHVASALYVDVTCVKLDKFRREDVPCLHHALMLSV